MIRCRSTRYLLVVGGCVMLTVTSCAFQGLNSVALPGAIGRGPGAATYHTEVANVGTLEANSPVMIDDVVVGSIKKMTVRDWHAVVELSVQPGVVVPANAIATIGQTSALGSMHLALGVPEDQRAIGRLPQGATIPLSHSLSYPSAERTLASLAAVVNGGGLGQLGEIIHSFNGALSGHQNQIRDLLKRLTTFAGTLNQQRDNIIATIDQLNRLAGTFAGRQEVITAALQRIPPALDVLINERPRITDALRKTGSFADTATELVNGTQADLVRNLHNLEPTIKALADVGPDLDTVLAYAPTHPFTQDLIDRGIRGDFLNGYLNYDLTTTRLKRGLLLGTRWGQEGAPLVPAPGDPWYLNSTRDPLQTPLHPPPSSAPAPPTAQPPAADPSAPQAISPTDTGGH